MTSDVCKHCTHAGCLDVCPTGAIFRTEFGTVVVQEDICNGCGYCVSACPFGVIDQREDDGRAWKCTMCYDRLHGGLEPACAQACPTEVDPVRSARRAAEPARASGSTSCTSGASRRPGSTATTTTTASAGGRVLPPARRARGVRAAARSGRADARSRAHLVCARGRGRPRSSRASARIHGTTAMTEGEDRTYYGRQMVKSPMWRPAIPGYFFLGGLAGGSSLLAASADTSVASDGCSTTARHDRARGDLGGSVALVVDLGRPERLHHMLRVFRPCSPMNMGSSMLATYAPLVGLAALSQLTGVGRPVGRGAGVVGGRATPPRWRRIRRC